MVAKQVEQFIDANNTSRTRVNLQAGQRTLGQALEKFDPP
jgi:hypothetical protein